MFIVMGAVLVGFGILYIWKPDIYRRGMWMRTSVAIRTMSEDTYRKYIRSLGGLFVAGGAALLGVGLWEYFFK